MVLTRTSPDLSVMPVTVTPVRTSPPAAVTTRSMAAQSAT